MICDFGDVVLVPFPFVDRPLTKPRPAVVLSAAGFNRVEAHSILAMITTASSSRWVSDQPISGLADAGLLKPCVVRLKLFTLENLLIARRIGRLAGDDWSRVKAQLGTAGL